MISVILRSFDVLSNHPSQLEILKPSFPGRALIKTKWVIQLNSYLFLLGPQPRLTRRRSTRMSFLSVIYPSSIRRSQESIPQLGVFATRSFEEDRISRDGGGRGSVWGWKQTEEILTTERGVVSRARSIRMSRHLLASTGNAEHQLLSPLELFASGVVAI